MSDHQAEKAQRLADKLLPEINEFKQSRKTLQLATCNTDGQPNASYAPYALSESGFYILVSDLARHGQNLKMSEQVSVMLIEDESEAKTVFARKRLTFDTSAERIERDTDDFKEGVCALETKHGEMITDLAALGDFNLYRLRPEHGLYVKGFGQAFKLSGADLLDVSWMTDGHHGEAKDPKQTEG
ncbi:MAG: heme utilization protein HutZ [Shewanella sp.]|nr:heme utilization protein HutZ [Shewanella sp.]MCF1431286.1 heme utilization protein HutZ [Shewanella sp.]MCF1437789.1 heme utilization protein HutZ [Shewanella sp.]MCF1457896.1 heme utilization protein HutZ [Shewanella sp.]